MAESSVNKSFVGKISFQCSETSLSPINFNVTNYSDYNETKNFAEDSKDKLTDSEKVDEDSLKDDKIEDLTNFISIHTEDILINENNKRTRDSKQSNVEKEHFQDKLQLTDSIERVTSALNENEHFLDHPQNRNSIVEKIETAEEAPVNDLSLPSLNQKNQDRNSIMHRSSRDQKLFQRSFSCTSLENKSQGINKDDVILKDSNFSDCDSPKRHSYYLAPFNSRELQRVDSKRLSFSDMSSSNDSSSLTLCPDQDEECLSELLQPEDFNNIESDVGVHAFNIVEITPLPKCSVEPSCHQTTKDHSCELSNESTKEANKEVELRPLCKRQKTCQSQIDDYGIQVRLLSCFRASSNNGSRSASICSDRKRFSVSPDSLHSQRCVSDGGPPTERCMRHSTALAFSENGLLKSYSTTPSNSLTAGERSSLSSFGSNSDTYTTDGSEKEKLPSRLQYYRRPNNNNHLFMPPTQYQDANPIHSPALNLKLEQNPSCPKHGLPPEWEEKKESPSLRENYFGDKFPPPEMRQKLSKKNWERSAWRGNSEHRPRRYLKEQNRTERDDHELFFSPISSIYQNYGNRESDTKTNPEERGFQESHFIKSHTSTSALQFQDCQHLLHLSTSAERKSPTILSLKPEEEFFREENVKQKENNLRETHSGKKNLGFYW